MAILYFQYNIQVHVTLFPPEVIHHYTHEGWRCDPLSSASERVWVGGVKVGCTGGVGSVSSAVEKVTHTGEWNREQ